MQSIKDCLSAFYSCRDEAVKIIVEISHKFAKKTHLWTLVESLLICPEENEAFEYVLSVQQSRLTEDTAGNPELLMETILTSFRFVV